MTWQTGLKVIDDLHFKEQADLSSVGLRLADDRLPGTCDQAALIRVIEDATAGLAERLSAATVLQGFGDARVPPVPEVLPVPGGRVEIGLHASRVGAVADAWRHVGVQPSWIEKEVPVWPTVLRDFWLGRYPITNSQYVAFLTATGWASRPTCWYLGAYPWDRPSHPVCGIAEADAEAYVGWLSAETGHPYRLPTEAEWEHAAKGWDGREFPWGDAFDPARANTRETQIHTTTPVGAFPDGAGPFGHLDLAGNVEEYVADTYRPYPGGRIVDDHLQQRLGDSYRITRGGSFARYGDLARTRRRHGAFPSPLYVCGFRAATDRQP